MDDIIVSGRTREEHDRNLAAVLDILQKANVTLNMKKCHKRQAEVKFLGHIFSAKGLHPDPARVSSVANLKPPKNVSAFSACSRSCHASFPISRKLVLHCVFYWIMTLHGSGLLHNNRPWTSSKSLPPMRPASRSSTQPSPRSSALMPPVTAWGLSYCRSMRTECASLHLPHAASPLLSNSTRMSRRSTWLLSGLVSDSTATFMATRPSLS